MVSRTALAVIVVTAAACSTTPQVSVQSSNTTPSETLPPVEQPTTSTTTTTTTSTTTTATTTIPEQTSGVDTIENTSSPHVLLASDVAGWTHLGPHRVPAEPTWAADDCDDMNTAWSTTGLAGARSRGNNGETTFRNTAIDLGSNDAATAVLDAVDRVPADCVTFTSSGTEFWSEPLEMPASEYRTSGIVIGAADLDAWALTFWQVDSTLVVLEVEGDGMWSDLDPLLDSLTARLEGTPTTAAEPEPAEVPVTTTTNTATIPSTSVPDVWAPQPTDDGWTSDPLASLIPDPEELGPRWRLDHAEILDAAPSDPSERIDGCDIDAPPTDAGLEVDYVNGDNAMSSISLRVTDGSAENAQSFVDAMRDVTGCELDPADFSTTGYDLESTRIDGADDSVVITAAATDDDARPGFSVTIVAARFGSTLVSSFHINLSDTGTATAEDIELAVLVVEAVAARR